MYNKDSSAPGCITCIDVGFVGGCSSCGRVTKYFYRGLPCSLPSGKEASHYVSGVDASSNAGGVLEWCYSKEDAQERFTYMKTFPQFKNLSIGIQKPLR